MNTEATKEERSKTARTSQRFGEKAMPSNRIVGAPNRNASAPPSEIMAGTSGRVLRPNAMIYGQGDAADAIYYIQVGRVQRTVVSKSGKERIVASLGPGEFFGVGSMINQPFRKASASTTEESTIVKIKKPVMLQMLRDNPVLQQNFITYLLNLTFRIEADLVDQLFNSSEQRLARLLLQLAGADELATAKTIPHVNQDTLAARVGTTRSRINTFMNKFRKCGYIEYGAEITVHPSLLNVFAHG